MSSALSTKNKYARRSKISEAKFRKLIQYFASDLDAKTIAALTGLNRNTVNRYLALIRERIAEFCHREFPFTDKMKLVKSHFEAFGKERINEQPEYINTPICGVFHTKDKICTIILPDHNYTSENPPYDCKMAPSKDENIQGSTRRSGAVLNNDKFISRIGTFLSYAKQRLTKFHGVPKSTFYLHLKECEFRFNYRNEDIYPILLKIIRDNPLC